IDRQEFIAVARRRTDRAEERPRRAIDAERERIDQKPGAAFAAEAADAVAIARDKEQESDVAKRNRDDDPALQHAVPLGAARLHRDYAPGSRTRIMRADRGSGAPFASSPNSSACPQPRDGIKIGESPMA